MIAVVGEHARHAIGERLAAGALEDQRTGRPGGRGDAEGRNVLAQALALEAAENALFQGVESMRSDAALFLVLFYSALEWVLICLCYWCLAQSFAGIVNLGLVDVLILMGFVSFGSVVQIPGVGGGMQVVSVLVLTELFGIRLELATAFAIYLWAITFVAIVPLGLFVALKEGLDWHSLKRIGRETSE